MLIYQSMTHGRGDFGKAPENSRTTRKTVHQQRVLWELSSQGKEEMGRILERQNMGTFSDIVTQKMHYEERQILSMTLPI